jgi:hypothetical protein
MHASCSTKSKSGFPSWCESFFVGANFASKDELRGNIEQFVAYFNQTMAKPFRWTMAQKPLTGFT